MHFSRHSSSPITCEPIFFWTELQKQNISTRITNLDGVEWKVEKRRMEQNTNLIHRAKKNWNAKNRSNIQKLRCFMKTTVYKFLCAFFFTRKLLNLNSIVRNYCTIHFWLLFDWSQKNLCKWCKQLKQDHQPNTSFGDLSAFSYEEKKFQADIW